MSWTKIGEGIYNNVYINEEHTLVFKIQKKVGDHTDSYDTPERSVPLWNKINPEYPASYYENEMGRGWIVPYIHGRQSSDSEIKKKLIDIYNRTGRIVLDAIGERNFITTDEGIVVCVDIGMALSIGRKVRERAYSEVSELIWNHNIGNYQTFFAQYGGDFPNSIQIIKALLLIRNFYPDILNTYFLDMKPALAADLATLYDHIFDLANRHMELDEENLRLIESFRDIVESEQSATPSI